LALNFLRAGDLFGEIAVLDGQTRTADAMAGEPSELFVVRRNDFLNFLESEPRVAVKLIALLCQRIRWASDRFEESDLLPLQVRLARRLCALATDRIGGLHFPGTAGNLCGGGARQRKPSIAAMASARNSRNTSRMYLLLNANRLRAEAREG
jgi:CRP/FNR family cyclic AMP-dependent transcriptional regulator